MQEPTTGAPALEARDLSKRYWRGALALSTVSFSIGVGTSTALVGPNAAGKSTLIKTFVGFERPTGGSCAVLGVDPHRNRRQALLHLGYVPQAPSLYRELSVGDHLDMARHVRSTFDREGAARHLDALGIDPRARSTSLSGGQQSQVMLAIALGARPDVLLLDEPLASLDPLARTEFLAVLKDAVRSRGMTAMLSSHIIADIEQACDSLMVLGVGRVLYHNSIAAALAEHAIFSGQEAAPPDTHTVGQFPSSSEGLVTLVRGAPPALSGPSSAATLDDIVKGYLTSGRTKHQVTAGVPT